MKQKEQADVTQGELAYRQLRSMIVNCELLPGRSVSEPELTLLLGMRKAAVRSALLRLTHDGWITAVPRYGYEITPLDMKDAVELTQLRLLTEPPAFRMATGRLDVAIIRAAYQRYETGYDKNDPASVTQFMTESRAFKLAVAQASGNKRLATWVEEVSEQIERYLRLSSMAFDMSPFIAENLLPLCEAMEKGQADKVEELATRNIQTVTAKILSALFHGGQVAVAKPSENYFTNESVEKMLGISAMSGARR